MYGMSRGHNGCISRLYTDPRESFRLQTNSHRQCTVRATQPPNQYEAPFPV